MVSASATSRFCPRIVLAFGGRVGVPLALALAATWPLARHAGGLLPLGTYDSHTPTLATEWTLWWNADRIRHLYAGYWNAPIFAPATDTFALSEPQPLSGLVFAPFYWLSGSLELAHNLTLLAVLTANGFFAARLLRRNGVREIPAALGGGMTTLLPFVHAQLGVLPFIALPGIIASIDAWLALVREPSWRRGALLGIAVTASYFLSCQLTLLFVLSLALGGAAAFPRALLRKKTWSCLALAALVFAALAAPVFAKQLGAARSEHLERSVVTVRHLSAGLNQYVRTPWRELLPLPGLSPAKAQRRAFYPGTVKLLLALLALAVCWKRRSLPPLPRASLGLAAAALLIGTGPLADVGPVSFYGALAHVVPGFRQIRGLFHTAALVQLAIVLLAAWAIDALAPRADADRDRAFWRWTIGIHAAGLLAVVELWPRGQRFFTPTPLSVHEGWIAALEARSSPDTVLAFVPFPEGRDVEEFEPTAEWMRLQARFERPMVNGYSSYFPAPHRRLALAMERFPAQKSLDALCGAGVSYLIQDLRFSKSELGQPDFSLVYDDPSARMRAYAFEHCKTRAFDREKSAASPTAASSAPAPR